MSGDDEAGSRYPTNSPTMILILQARHLEARLEGVLKEIGLSLRRLGLLGHLSREPGISYSALARRAGIRVQSLHPIVDGLARDGYVATDGAGGQGRAAIIELTGKGREALSLANAIIAELDRDQFGADAVHEDLGRALAALGESLWRKRSAPAPTK